jgi:hypothetical protein
MIWALFTIIFCHTALRAQAPPAPSQAEFNILAKERD